MKGERYVRAVFRRLNECLIYFGRASRTYTRLAMVIVGFSKLLRVHVDILKIISDYKKIRLLPALHIMLYLPLPASE